MLGGAYYLVEISLSKGCKGEWEMATQSGYGQTNGSRMTLMVMAPELLGSRTVLLMST